MAKPRNDQEWITRLNESAPSADARIFLDEPALFGSEVVKRYRLGNGLKVFLLVDKSAPVISYHTWFSVGSRHERLGKTGLAHFFEHLMFNETSSLEAGQFDRILEENGAESNAGTWVDWTYYYESLPADRIGIAITLESDRMAHLVLREPQVASEKEVVANERRFRVEDDIDGSANELLYKTAFTCHPYHWPTIGFMHDILNYNPSDCEDFYRTFYSPNNALVVIVGNIKEENVLTKIRDAYGKIPSFAIPAEDTHPEPPQTEQRVVEVKKPTATEKLFIGYRGPALGDADHALVTVLNEVLFGGRASRIYRKLVISEEIATDVRGWSSSFRDPGLYEMSITARSGKTIEMILSVLDAELEKVRRELISVDEIERAKARLELSLLQSLETMGGKAEQIGFFETVLGDPAAAFRKLEAYRRVNVGDLRRVARRYLVDTARTLVMVRPDGAVAMEAAE